MKQGIRAGVLGVEGEVDGGGGVVGARAGDDLHPVVDPLHAVVHGSDVLPDGHGGRLAGGAADADGVHAAGDLGVDQPPEGVVVDVSVGVKRGGNGHAGAGEHGSAHDITTLSFRIRN